MQVLELLELTGTAVEGEGKGAVSAGDSFLQQTADEISKQAQRRVQLVKERSDLEKIVEYVASHNDAVRRKCVAYEEYLEAVRDQKVHGRAPRTSTLEPRPHTLTLEPRPHTLTLSLTSTLTLTPTPNP